MSVSGADLQSVSIGDKSAKMMAVGKNPMFPNCNNEVFGPFKINKPVIAAVEGLCQK